MAPRLRDWGSLRVAEDAQSPRTRTRGTTETLNVKEDYFASPSGLIEEDEKTILQVHPG